MPDPSPWWTVEQAASYAQVSTGVIYAACRAKKDRDGKVLVPVALRHARVGGRRDIRLRREWIDAWLESSQPQEVAPGTT